jgi:hypothetical protein
MRSNIPMSNFIVIPLEGYKSGTAINMDKIISIIPITDVTCHLVKSDVTKNVTALVSAKEVLEAIRKGEERANDSI